MKNNKEANVPKIMKDKYEEIESIIKTFCNKYLNEEYEEVCCQLCAALCRKRPSPLLSGKSNTWACGIVHAIGFANFLFDSSQTPFIKAADLYANFGVSSGTGSGKSKQIRDLMKISQFDRKWTLPSGMESNPLIWMIEVNGFLIDIRYAKKEIQEIAYAKGLIPYIPYEKMK